MSKESKAKLYIYMGWLMMFLAGMAMVWIIWSTQLSQLWNQNRAQASFVINTPQATLTVMPTLQPTATPQPTAIPIQKDDFLLEIPSIDLKWVVHHILPEEENDESWGIPKALLDLYGIIDYPHLSFPGEEGLAAVAGHRDISGSPLWKIEKINIEDTIIITRKDGREIRYTVYKILTVVPDDSVFWEMEYPNELRVVSCLIGSTKFRVIVFAFQQ